ncbi:hypothetical protein AMECASPLE_026026 [Ameca splendens]|uniref:Uncharacterized protein n=1 Tax=Ameca splendens TaxID=208324 RepID=A0ABV0Y4W8_9TELE
MSSVTGEECQRCETEEMRDTCCWGFQGGVCCKDPSPGRCAKQSRKTFSLSSSFLMWLKFPRNQEGYFLA